ncbi:hypothetical protein QBZ16_000405 [Prototheca wickerhamii]|uniref:RRM domain-containing protein n=1 Tax=Prototheca wickerhamii TaxID=3111 RepID=A0AAD9MJW3_PROWI|nr:hypothetical protein QBZ16_000405 [Prototheca wickerhamii]
MAVPTPSAAIPCAHGIPGSAGTAILSAGQLSTLSESSAESFGEVPLPAVAQHGPASPSPLLAPDVESRKVVVLGIPWQTEDATLEAHFSRYGPVEEVLIMRERLSGKSRGFGFVTYASAAHARAAIASEHVVDGRRCEARLALPEGKRFGAVQDAYMPKDPSKQGHRGIGFVTYARAESVDAVMARSHVLGGNEVAIDRATPKERGAAGAGAAALPGRLSMSQPNLPLLAGSGGSFAALQALPGMGSPTTAPFLGQGPAQAAGTVPHAATTHGSSAVAEYLFALQQQASFIQQRTLGSQSSSAARLSPGAQLSPHATTPPPGLSNLTVGSGGPAGAHASPPPRAFGAHDASPTTLSELLGSLDQREALASAGRGLGAATPPGSQGPTVHGGTSGLQAVLAAQAAALHAQRMAHSASHGSMVNDASPSPSRFLAAGSAGEAPLLGAELSLGQYPADIPRSLSGALSGPLWSMGSGVGYGGGYASAFGGAGGSTHGGGSLHGGAAAGGAGPASARAGPRLFVGKLHRDTSEADLREYFAAFGFVLDVYLPRDRVNKRDHRGFGFVTFETDAAIQRVVAHGPHQIRGAFVAIDAAVPRQDEPVPSSLTPQGSFLRGSAHDMGPLSSTLEGLKLSGSGVWGGR